MGEITDGSIRSDLKTGEGCVKGEGGKALWGGRRKRKEWREKGRKERRKEKRKGERIGGKRQ
jgi:hypothetical protein